MLINGVCDVCVRVCVCVLPEHQYQEQNTSQYLLTRNELP